MSEMTRARDVEATVAGLELIGTPKQVDWARAIAERVLLLLEGARANHVAWGEDQLAALPERLRAAMRPRVERMVGEKGAALDAAREWALGHAEARWWIDVAQGCRHASDLAARHQAEQEAGR